MYDLVTMEMPKFDFTGLMIFVLDRLPAVGVWLPFTFGKLTALLSSPWPKLISSWLDPRRTLQVLHWPIRVICIVMDPVVDTIFFLMGVLILLSITRLPDGSLNTVQLALSGIIPSNALEMSTHFTITMDCQECQESNEECPTAPVTRSQGAYCQHPPVVDLTAAEALPKVEPAIRPRSSRPVHVLEPGGGHELRAAPAGVAVTVAVTVGLLLTCGHMEKVAEGKRVNPVAEMMARSASRLTLLAYTRPLENLTIRVIVTGSALLEKGLVLGRAEHDEGRKGEGCADDGNERRQWRMVAVAVATAAGCEIRFNSIGFLCE
ncbi:hypothetical protein EDB89DRAFT_1906301 [Lactarius sanguifluus]|nr:hypothetical protein EDB89DRAFT_1906301 [Lactarius sanguifluus]